MLLREPAELPEGRIRRVRSAFMQYAVFIGIGFVVLAPLAPIAYQAFIDRPLYDAGQVLTLTNFGELFSSPRLRSVMVNTVLFAVLSTLTATIMGAVAAFFVVRTDMPGAKHIGSAFVFPLYLSSLILAFGWVLAYGPSGYYVGLFNSVTGLGISPSILYTIPGMALVAGVAESPIAYIYCSSALRAANPAFEEAARTAGASTGKIVRGIVLPLLKPSLLYAMLLLFVAGLESLSIPLILGSPSGIEMFASFIYNEGLARANPDYGLIAAFSMFTIGLVTLLIAAQRKLIGDERRFVTVSGKSTPPRRFRLGRVGWVTTAVFALGSVFAVFLPLSSVLLRGFTSVLSPFVPLREALTLDNYDRIISTPGLRGAVTTSAFIALVGGLLATAAIALMCLVAYRSKFRFARSLNTFGLIPRAVPAVVVSIGVFWAMFFFAPLGWLRNSVWILIFAFFFRFLPLGVGLVAPTLMRYDRSLDSAARLAGADWITATFRVPLRLVSPALLGVFAIMFTHFLREYASAVFIISPDVNVIGTTMLRSWLQGNVGLTAAFAALEVTISLVIIWLAGRLVGVKLHG